MQTFNEYTFIHPLRLLNKSDLNKAHGQDMTSIGMSQTNQYVLTAQSLLE